MSFGTFSAKYGADEPSFPLDMGVEADLPFTFSEGQGIDSFMSITEDEGPTAQIHPEDPSVARAVTMPSLPDLPWSLIIPAAIIGVVGIGVVWYLNGKKMPEIAL